MRLIAVSVRVHLEKFSDVFHLPRANAWAKLHRLGKTAALDAGPPSALPHGEHRQDGSSSGRSPPRANWRVALQGHRFNGRDAPSLPPQCSKGPSPQKSPTDSTLHSERNPPGSERHEPETYEMDTARFLGFLGICDRRRTRKRIFAPLLLLPSVPGTARDLFAVA